MKILKKIIIKKDEFDDIIVRIFNQFGVSESQAYDLSTPMNLSHYNKQLLSGNGLKHFSKGLTYTVPLNESQTLSISQSSQNLCSLYQPLKKCAIYSVGILEDEFFDYDGKSQTLGLKLFKQLKPNAKKVIEHKKEKDLLNFFGAVLKQTSAIQSKQGIKPNLEHLKKLCVVMKPYVSDSKAVSLLDKAAALDIHQSINTLISSLSSKQNDQNKVREKLIELRAYLMMGHPALRENWVLPCENTKPVDRVILISLKDLKDREVVDTINLMVKKHADENIVVTFEPKDVVEVNQLNQKNGERHFKLQIIGHGSVAKNTGEKPTITTKEVGPFRSSSARLAGMEVAKLVNQCSLINHIKLTACFSGLLNDDVEIKETDLVIKAKKAELSDRKTYTLVIDKAKKLDGKLFSAQSPALACWNALKLENRDMSLTVSPSIIEVGPKGEHLIWKKTDYVQSGDGIKNIHITTENGPKKLKV